MTIVLRVARACCVDVSFVHAHAYDGDQLCLEHVTGMVAYSVYVGDVL